MSAGTLTLNNNSASVAGTDTTFTTELAAGDFIVVVVGGVPFTLPVLEVNSNTRLTLVSNYTGPRATGAAWSAVPRVALNMVTAAMVVQNTQALLGLNYDKQNWQQVFSGTGTITVRLPDGTTFSGPAWNSITTALSEKADKGANSDITSLSGLTTALSVTQGGTGATTEEDARTNLGLEYGTTAGTVAEGNDARLNTVDGKSTGIIDGVQLTLNGNLNDSYGGNLTSRLVVTGKPTRTASFIVARPSSDDTVAVIRASDWSVSGGDKEWTFLRSNGNAIAPGNWVNGGSTVKIKEKVEDIQNPRETMRIIRACTWRLKTKNADGRFGIGVLAEGLYEAYPEAKVTAGDIELRDGTVVKDALSVQAGDSGVLAAVHHATIISLMDENEAQQEEINQLKADMEALKKIVEQLAAR
ncbi:tail fiber domain-containing protein [Citrobacter sp. Cb019]|uniref:tail fiber domain-containing protein n=1 Tax=Citrobacter sp. Cb019 TaxID=2985017 RepID=UPI00257B7ECA|nr:tail fiber domain-containing protein [Citrobacter sp. Cb019]MDM3404044.1 tail fiber domain-containing protein [Citrobacter sp. Cb019]